MRENYEKRERAEKKILDEIAIQKKRSHDIAVLQQNMNYLLDVKALMEEKIKEYKIYEV